MILLIIVLVLILALYIKDETVSVIAFDKRPYIVRALPDRQRAANILARMRAKIKRFIGQVGDKRLHTRYKSVLMENINRNYTSYTVSKGRRIHLCLRENDASSKIIDENTLFFVALHELAHVMTDSIGHTPEFWNNFRVLLRKAISLGYYKYVPYHITPQRYCGTIIADTPLRNKN